MIQDPTNGELADKSYLLEYFKHRATEMEPSIKETYGESQYKLRAAEINKLMNVSRESLVRYIVQKSQNENWPKESTLDCVLKTTYASYVVMIDFRNDMWPYDYMTFSRRIGELWEPFCRLAWEFPIKSELTFIVPPLFSEVKKQLNSEIREFIDSLLISDAEKIELRGFYEKVWTLVGSGEIKLELDLHFSDGETKFNVDFKSGFSSNEKGNTNRLLLVASIYKILAESYLCEIYVRSAEETNNHYLQTLKNSGLWNVYCGAEAYGRMSFHTGFDFKKWIDENIAWDEDLEGRTKDHVDLQELGQYLKW